MILLSFMGPRWMWGLCRAFALGLLPSLTSLLFRLAAHACHRTPALRADLPCAFRSEVMTAVCSGILPSEVLGPIVLLIAVDVMRVETWRRRAVGLEAHEATPL